MNKWKDNPFVDTDIWGFEDELYSPWETRLIGIGLIASILLVLWAVFL